MSGSHHIVQYGRDSPKGATFSIVRVREAPFLLGQNVAIDMHANGRPKLRRLPICPFANAEDGGEFRMGERDGEGIGARQSCQRLF